MRFLLTLALIVDSAGSSTSQQHQGELFLDLLTIQPPPERNEQSGGIRCGGGSGGSSHYRPPVQVTLAGIDHQNLTPGAEIVIEVLVENVSDAPIELATSRDRELIDTCQMSGDDVRTSFAIVSRTKRMPHGVVAVGPALYGSRQVPGTTMTLNPGERVRVRMPATVTMLGWRPRLTDAPQAVEVAAMFAFQRGHLARVEMSGNRRTIQASRP